TLTIDGRTVTVPAGTNIVDAARNGQVAVPVFCYHPKMKAVGMCRMCLVEVWTPLIDRATNQPVLDEHGQPKLALMANKLQAGCVTPVSPGMVVNTVTERVKFAQRGQLEFLLTSHPLDCPVCDKGGECPLQNLTMEWGPGNSRFEYADKYHNVKPIPLGDLIYLDRERCILCARCVRFQDEIAGDPVLGFDSRGRSWEIISKSDPPFDSKFSGNTTDICPVGALTTSDFRFKARVWELRSVPSICPHCPVGCDISLDMRYDQLMRVMPRENDYVNEIWICDKGRFGMRYFGAQERITTPLIKRNNKWVEASWEEAIRLVADKLTLIRASASADALAGLAGPRLPNEDLYLFQKLFRETLGSHNIDHRAGVAGEPAIDELTPQLGVGMGTNLMALGKGTSVLVIGADPEEEAPLYVLRLRGILSRGGEVHVVNAYPTKLGRQATRDLRLRPGSEAQLALALIRVILEENLQKDEFIGGRLRNIDQLRQGMGKLSMSQLAAACGLAEETIRAMARSFASAENGIIIYGRAALGGDPALLRALANLALITGKAGRANSGLIALTPGSNTRGALDMGVRPDAGPGGAAPQQAGLSASEMWGASVEGRLRGMYIAGLNPARGNPAAAQALDAIEFLVVQELFMTETAQLADVVLPAAAFAEREGTFTNAERRVQRFRQARKAEGARPDWQIFQDVALAVHQIAPPASAPIADGRKSAKARTTAVAPTTAVAAPPATWDYITSSDVADEISQVVPGYAGTRYTSLDLARSSWGRQPNEAFYYDGTSYENTEGVGVQLPALADDARTSFTISFREPQEPAADERYPLALMAAARLYDGGEWARGSKLQSHIPPAHVILSAADAQRLGVGMGEQVQVRSAAGAIELPAQIDAGLAEGLALLPLVRGAGAPAVLMGGLTRVAVSKAE
ncbi:MAG: NADH-quinone oxidoreductase subunit NuoG, partial [Roseiflexaceae bacterium]